MERLGDKNTLNDVLYIQILYTVCIALSFSIGTLPPCVLTFVTVYSAAQHVCQDMQY